MQLATPTRTHAPADSKKPAAHSRQVVAEAGYRQLDGLVLVATQVLPETKKPELHRPHAVAETW